MKGKWERGSLHGKGEDGQWARGGGSAWKWGEGSDMIKHGSGAQASDKTGWAGSRPMVF